MHNILALDQSSRITGYAVFRDDELYAYDKFELTDSSLDKRLNRIRNKVAELISDFDIDEVLLEDIYLDDLHGNNASTFKILAEVFGVISELLEEMKIPHTAILAGTWKSTLGVKGKNRPEQKANAAKYVERTYGIKPTQDECDAICIGAHYIKKQSEGFNWE